MAHKLFHVLYPIWCVLSDNNEHDDGTGEKGRGRKEVGGVWVKSSEKSESELVSKSHLFENWAGQRQGSRQGEEPALPLEISFL